jgi:hypothetical protein
LTRHSIWIHGVADADAFCPSPTGELHLGHAYSAVLAHHAARAAGGSFLIRIDDIDGSRSREDYVAASLADLAWLGLEWDDEPVRQSARLGDYAAALGTLRTRGLVYPCFCTRADIAASLSAPHGPAGAIYPGTCRHLSDAERERRMQAEPHCWRLDMAHAVALAGELQWEEAGQGDTRRRSACAWRHRSRAQGCARQLSSRKHVRRRDDGGNARHSRRRPHRLDRRPPPAPGAARPADPALSPPWPRLRPRRKKARETRRRRVARVAARSGVDGRRSPPIWRQTGFPLAIRCKIPR